MALTMQKANPVTLLKAAIVDSQVTPSFIHSPNTYQLSTYVFPALHQDRDYRSGWDTTYRSGTLSPSVYNNVRSPKWTPIPAKDRRLADERRATHPTGAGIQPRHNAYTCPLDSCSSSHPCASPQRHAESWRTVTDDVRHRVWM